MPQPKVLPSGRYPAARQAALIRREHAEQGQQTRRARTMPRISSLRSNESPWRTGREAGLALPLNYAAPPAVLEGVVGWFSRAGVLPARIYPGGAVLEPAFAGLLEDLRRSGFLFEPWFLV